MLQLIESTRRLYEAVHHTSKTKVIVAAQPRLAKALKKGWHDQGQQVVNGLIKLKAEFPPEVSESFRLAPVLRYVGSLRLREALNEDDLNSIFDDAEKSTFNQLSKPLEDAAGAMLLAGARQIISELNIQLSFDLKNPRAVAYIKAHGADLISQINDETRRMSKSILQQAAEEGWSYQKTARALVAEYDGFGADVPYRGMSNRGEFISVTELGQGYEEGNFIPIQDLMEGGVSMEKQWDTAPELSKTGPCADCQGNADEDWIPADQAHQSGDDHPLAHPDCYCDEYYQVKE